MNKLNIIGSRISSALKLRGKKQKDLAAAINVSANVISYFCCGSRTPNVEQLINISNYLNVTTDYLLGRTLDPNIIPAASDELGISMQVVHWLKSIKDRSSDHYRLSDDINEILGNRTFHLIISDLRDYNEAVKAEVVYYYLCHNIGQNCHGMNFNKQLTEEVHKIAESNIYGDTMSKCLIGEDYVRNLDVSKNKVVADILCDGIVGGFSEVYASRVSRLFTTFLQDLRHNAVDKQTREMTEIFERKETDSDGTH